MVNIGRYNHSEMAKKLTPEEWWRGVLTGVDPALSARTLRSIFRLIPNAPRCKFCNGPYQRKWWGNLQDDR